MTIEVYGLYCGKCPLSHLILLGTEEKARRIFLREETIQREDKEASQHASGTERPSELGDEKHMVLFVLWKEYAVCSVENGLETVKQNSGNDLESTAVIQEENDEGLKRDHSEHREEDKIYAIFAREGNKR